MATGETFVGCVMAASTVFLAAVAASGASAFPAASPAPGSGSASALGSGSASAPGSGSASGAASGSATCSAAGPRSACLAALHLAPSSTPGAAPSSTARAVAPSSTSAPAFRSAPPAAFPFSRTAAALAAWQRNASEAARWAHPSWWAPALDVPPATASAAFDALRDALASTRAAALAACSRALLRAADVALPGFDSLRAPNPAVLDALPVEVGLRVLRMRALLLRRAEVRRLIDKQSRRRLAHWVGVPLERLAFAPGQGAAHAALGNEWTQAAPGNELARLLADMPADLSTKVSAKAPRHVPANAPDAARLVARGDLPPLDEIDDERLAYEGYALIARDMQEAAWSQKLAAAERQGARNGRSDDPHEAHHHKHASEPSHPHHHPSPAARPCPLLRLALPRDLPPPWPSASARELDVGGTALLFAQLPELLPEWAWLFG